MNKLSTEKMAQYFWSALATENTIAFSKHMKEEGLTRFEDVMANLGHIESKGTVLKQIVQYLNS